MKRFLSILTLSFLFTLFSIPFLPHISIRITISLSSPHGSTALAAPSKRPQKPSSHLTQRDKEIISALPELKTHDGLLHHFLLMDNRINRIRLDLDEAKKDISYLMSEGHIALLESGRTERRLSALESAVERLTRY